MKSYRIYISSILLFFVTLLPISLLAQATNDKVLARARKHISLEEFSQAKTILSDLAEKNPQSAEVLYYYGIAQLNLQENQAGKASIEKALNLNPQVDTEYSLYWKGMAHYLNYETKEAKESFEQYKAKLSEKSSEYKNINTLMAALETIDKQNEIKPDFYASHLSGDVNTIYEDHSPLLTNDETKLIYTSKNQESTEKKEQDRGEFFENIYAVNLDNFQPKGHPENLSDVLNTDNHDATIQLFDNDTKLLVYKISGGGNIYQSTKENGKWSTPKPLGKNVNSSDFESSAYVTTDGKTMYFSSSRKSKTGSLNIFKTTMGKDGNWQEAELLGPEINSENADEDCPFVTADGKTIYFSSKGHGSMGGYDIFVSNWNESENKWSEAKNLGMQVNSVGDDMYFLLDKGNTHGYYASFRDGGKGGMDIYYVGKYLPVVLQSKITVEGDADASVGEVKVKLKDQDYGDEYKAVSDDNSTFNASLNNNTEYEVSLYSENYKSGKEPFSVQTIKVPRTITSNEKIEQELSIPLSDYQKLERSFLLKGSLATSDGYKVDGDLEVLESRSGKTIATAKTDNGEFNVDFKSVIGRKFVIKVLSNGESFEKAGSFATENNREIKRDLVLAFSENNQTGIVKSVEKKSGYTSSSSILFGTNNQTISDSYKKELDRIVKSIKSGTVVNVLLEGYADNVGKAAYNKKLSKRRAKQVYRYLVAKGLDKKLITVEFYGEENPVGNNDTEEGRKLNRRVEIHIK